MFEKFTEKAINVVTEAQHQAYVMKNAYVQPEHLLIAIMEQAKGVSLKLFRMYGITVEAVKESVEGKLRFEKSDREVANIPFSTEFKNLLKETLDLASKTGNSYILFEHLFIAVISDKMSYCPRILEGFKFDINNATNILYKMVQKKNKKKLHPEIDDTKDYITSSKKETEDFTELMGEDIKGMKIAIPNYFVTDVVDKKIRDKFNEIVELLKQKGCQIEYIDIKYLENCVTLYQIIGMAEASSNLARYDGIRYGYSYENPQNLEELYTKTREYGFGEEVKRRIMVGSYILSGKNAKIYYDKAMMIRKELRDDFKDKFKKYDLIIGPAATTTAFDVAKEFNDPSKSFLDDILVNPVNMAGLPALSLPIGFNHDNLPIGMQIIGNYFEEDKIYKLASFIEKELSLDTTPKGVC